MEKHRIIETSFGEVMLVEKKDEATQETYCEMYAGDNFDDFVGEINCGVNDDDDVIQEAVEEALYF